MSDGGLAVFASIGRFVVVGAGRAKQGCCPLADSSTGSRSNRKTRRPIANDTCLPKRGSTGRYRLYHFKQTLSDVNQSIDQSINQSINKSINQSITYQSINPSYINQSIDKLLTEKSASKSINQSINPQVSNK